LLSFEKVAGSAVLLVKIINAIAFVAIVLTAGIAILAVQAKEVVQEPTQEATTVATTENSTEPTQEPTETQAPATEPTEATEPIEETEPTEPSVRLYNVPYDEDLQLHIIAQAEQYGLDPAIVFAVIWKESRYFYTASGDNDESLGIMQIKQKFHQWRMDCLGVTDLLDPYQNVMVGCHLLGEKFQKYGDIEMALMIYNAGETGAKTKWFDKGIYSNKYSQAILAKAEELRG
jgi:soluble lytic murein transglycosylase-like protein